MAGSAGAACWIMSGSFRCCGLAATAGVSTIRGGSRISASPAAVQAAQEFWDPDLAERYDVFVYYDAMGRSRQTRPDGSTPRD